MAFKDQLSEPLVYPDAADFKGRGGASQEAAARLTPYFRKTSRKRSTPSTGPAFP